MISVIHLYFSCFSGEKVIIFQGRTAGIIATSPQGPKSFGWDPIFIPTEHDAANRLSYAEMDKEAKNSISHRAKALEKLRNYFVKQE